MTLVHRVLSPQPITSLEEYVRRRGGRGLEVARQVEPAAIIDELEAAGLRGRGGSGFPTHRKWRTVAENRSSFLRATVVVNAAEGEPGTFKDRTILLNDPYQVIEGALIAARAVGAGEVVIGLKRAFAPVVARVRAALDEIVEAGWTETETGRVVVRIHEGPDEYLFGEETALLESIDGRRPFPRVAPPFRRGVTEVLDADVADTAARASAANAELAGPDDDTVAPPALVDNVETLANVPRIIARGGRWFRTEGTAESPGTIVCTITGATAHAGVGEVIMGTTLREAIELIGGGPLGEVTGVLTGVANAVLPPDRLDTPLTYEDMAAAGSGLGSAGYTVLGPQDDPVAVVAGVSRFLAVESCGQCTPCKDDGLALADLLERLGRNELVGVAGDTAMAQLERHVVTVSTGARCSLANQQQAVVQGLLDLFPDAVDGHRRGSRASVEPALVAELLEIDEGEATIDLRHREKQPDWSYGPVGSGAAPVDAARDEAAVDG